MLRKRFFNKKLKISRTKISKNADVLKKEKSPFFTQNSRSEYFPPVAV